MRKLSAMLVSTKPVTKTVLNWQIETVENTEKAIKKIICKPYKVLAISSEVPESDFAKAKKMIAVLQPETVVISIAGQEDLGTQLNTAFFQNKYRNKAYKVLDNSFEIALSNALKNSNN
ncbi:hypothetical protein [Mesonia sp. K7]|uniref:hypothetical protein n=1 Tax=Mesonia sp. K7 TaxID=2218606 RepID=UPI000DAAC7A6|nr:hypothetical protein [Mesonia sp. K7]PZD77850.1 hypothetical protein DNG35_07055 [Mesonia sp. K7]